MNVSMRVNGEVREHDVEARTLLVHYLREVVGLTGTNIGCDTSSCGACTVLLGGESVKSCTVLAAQADGADIITIEGLADGDRLHPMQEAFREHHGLQCGYCTPGMVMAAVSLLDEHPDPTEAEVREGSRATCAAAPATTTSSGHPGGSPGQDRGGGGVMIPAAFDYQRATSVDEAVGRLVDTAKTPSCWPAATRCCR